MLTQLFLAAAVMAMPLMPPGIKPHRHLRSPKDETQCNPVLMVRSHLVPKTSITLRSGVAATVPPSGLTITNISAANGLVTLGWAVGVPPYQVQGTDLSMPWIAISGQTMANSVSFPTLPQHFFRVQGSIQMPFTATLTNGATQLQWANPDTDMSDTLTPLRIYEAPQIPAGDTPDNFAPPWTEVTTLSPADPQPINATQATDSVAPNPTTVYKIRQITANGVLVPHQMPNVSRNVPGVALWAQQFGGTQLVPIGAVVLPGSVFVDSTGAVIVVGYFLGPVTFGTITLTPPDAHGRAFIAKYSNSGVCQWARMYGGNVALTTSTFIYAGAVDSSGNIFIAGDFLGPSTDMGGGPLANHGSGLDIVLAKYDSSGNHLWSKAVGGTADDRALACAVDPSGNVWIGGFANGADADFGGGALPDSATAGSAVLAQYRAVDGAYLYAHRTGGTAINGLAVDPNGFVGAVGFLSIPTDFGSGLVTPAAGSYMMFALKYSLSGTYQWAHAYGNGGQPQFYSCAFNSTGDLFAGGIFFFTVNFGGATYTAGQGGGLIPGSGILLRLSTTGSYVWSDAIGTDNSQTPFTITTIAVDSQNSLVVGAIGRDSTTIHNQYLQSYGFVNPFFMKYDSAGGFQWVRRINSQSDDGLTGVATDSSNRILFTGQFGYIMSFVGQNNTITLTNSGRPDGYLTQYTP